MISEILKDLQDGTRELARIMRTADGEEQLRRIHRMQEQLEGLTAGFVGLARHRRVTWVRISRILHISEDTARHRYTEAHILRRLARFTRARGSVPTSLTDMYALRSGASNVPAPRVEPITADAAATEGPDAGSDPNPTPRDPSGAAFNRLAPVLSMLVRTSQQTNKDVSAKMGISPSYLSRILSGERVPTWPLTKKFARACGADPDVLRTVWESEKSRSTEPPPDEEPPMPAAVRLHQAVRTLHARAGRPGSQDVALASRWTLSVSDVASVSEGSQIPRWRVLKTVVDLLGGDRDYFRKLWREAQAEQEQGPVELAQDTLVTEVPAGVDEVLTAFSDTFNEEEFVESQRARLLEKRAKEPQSNRLHRLSELSARRGAPGRGWTMRIARPGL
ncbi:helix-turn-helix domain-containing protein [Streptomyces sp. NPDC017949]|uniref:helix-turn-helix domain-containing protein n=1 Tax=Streptomyces sp. NPDC017949 TaxID=3365020 RepID=UPI00378AFABF